MRHNAFLRDMNVGVSASDERRIEVLAGLSHNPWEMQIWCIRHAAVGLAGFHTPNQNVPRWDRSVREKMVGRQLMQVTEIV